ncbi:MAG TPA: transporter [Gemmatimonadaceae bacterium]|nr:transporter [Gemmatimonadaceae bacterium]
MWRVLSVLPVLWLVAAPLHAQGLREKLSGLFIFGPGEDPLFLAGSGDPNNPSSLRVHGSHFIPAAVSSNGTMIAFLTDAIGANVAQIPVSATSSGETFRFQGGVPVRTSRSPGPVFGERAQTLGRGRILVGANRTGIDFRTLRGVDLHNIELTFTHENVDFPGCDSVAHGDCSLMGIPSVENDIMPFHLSLDVNLAVTSFFVTYGLFDHVDIGVVLPIVATSLRGESIAQIIPFGGPTAAHFFGGTPEHPVLSASRFEEGSATGLGDVAVRVKVSARESGPVAVAVLGDVRFPTGSTDDLLGSGIFQARGLGIFSAQFGAFSPHVNFGYLVRGGSVQNDAVLATVGFDHLMAPWATLAADVISELQVGSNKLRLPGQVIIQAPFQRTVDPTTIPDTRDDIVNGSLGMKFTATSGLTLVANAAWPLNRGGLRPDIMWTLGLEYNF